MKHGRRHKTLKEQTYVARFGQDAEGYSRAYRPIDVAQPQNPQPLPEAEVPLGLALSARDKRRLKRAGVDPDAQE